MQPAPQTLHRDLIPVVRRGVAIVTLLLVAALAPAASADSSSLYRGPGPRPGPDLLYDAPATAPQLRTPGAGTRRRSWSPAPTAYRDGEFLYQDYLYDDHGANGVARPDRPARRTRRHVLEAQRHLHLPDRPGLRRQRRRPGRVPRPAAGRRHRVPDHAEHDEGPALFAFTIAIGGTPGVDAAVPERREHLAPADLFLTVHGTARSSSPMLVTPLPTRRPAAPTVTVDRDRRQIEVDVPHAAWNPGQSTVRLAAGVGPVGQRERPYLLPQPTADATHPGGAGTGRVRPPSSTSPSAPHEPIPRSPQTTGATSTNAGLVARPRSRARRSRPATSAASTPTSTSPSSPPASTTTAASRRPARWTASSPATSRPAQGVDYRAVRLPAPRTVDMPRPSTRATSSRTRSTSRGSRRPPPGYGMTLLLHSLVGQLQPVPRQPQPVAVRRPRPRLDRDHARGARARRLYYDLGAAPTCSRCGPTSPSATSSTRPTRDSPATRWAATAPSSSPTQFPDLFAKGQPTVGPPGSASRFRPETRPAGWRPTTTACSRRCATSRS